MTERQLNIQFLIRKLRFKYKQDLANSRVSSAQLDNVLWYSYPVVYGSGDFNGQKEAVRLIDARKRKKQRYNRYLKGMQECYEKLFFITLTWDDDSLNRLSDSTRRKYIQNWLNENCNDFLANVDYGKKNGREHYHAVVSFRNNVTPVWVYGFYVFQEVNFNSCVKDVYKISSYLLKLTNHAGKFGTGKSFHKKFKENVDNLPF